MSVEQFETWTNSQIWNTKKPNPRTKSRETLSHSSHFALTPSKEIPNFEPSFKSEDERTVSWRPDQSTYIHFQTFILLF